MPTLVESSLDQFLGSDYIDVRSLGEDGGLSRLFRAHKQSLDVDVVIKRMKMDPQHPANVKREVKVMTSLRHQYLPRIFDFKTDQQGYCYTIMELIPGCTLRKYVEENGALKQAQMLKWFRQLCQAVQYMHSQSIIHSDIKPENIMITPDGNICLLDFNASLNLRDDTPEAVGATMCYAAPEQYNVPLDRFGDPVRLSQARRAIYDMAAAAQGMGKISERTDLYGIGATAYYMMTGYDPPNWNEPQVSLVRYDITLGDPLRQIIERCLEKEQARRFSSAKVTLQALNNLARLDKRYAAWRRSCQMAILVVGAGLILSAFAIVQGLLTLNQEHGQAYNELIQRAQLSAESLDFTTQQELLLEAITLDRERPEAYAYLGALLYQQGDYQQAIELLSQVDSDDTGTLGQDEAVRAHGQIQYMLASCRYQMQDYGQALTAYQLAAYFCPDETAYQRDLAVCYARLGYADQARQALTVLNQMQTQVGDTELVSGEIAYAEGSYAEALELLAHAAQVSENHVVILRAAVQAAQCCRQLDGGQTNREVEILTNATQRLNASENSSLIQLQAEALMRLAVQNPDSSQTSYEQALACLTTLIDRGQATFAVRQNAALVLEYLDRFQEAEAMLLQLAADYPQDYRPPMRLALLYSDWEGTKPLEERNYDQFRSNCEQARQLYSGSTPDSEMVWLENIAAQLGI